MVFGGDRPTFDKWAFRPLSELFEEAELSQPAQAVLDHWSTLYAGPPTQTALIMHARLVDHYMNGAYYPEGGGQMLSARLIQVIEACGGEVRTLSPVAKIIVEDGIARGVELESGGHITAPIVVGNGDYRRMITQLIEPEHLDPATRKWAEEARMTLGLVCVYVAVSREMPGPNTNYFTLPDFRTDEMYAELDSGKVRDGDLPVYIAMASRKDPGNEELCPPGHTNFQIMSLAPRGYDYWGVGTGPADGGTYRRDAGYRQRKQEITDRMVDAAEAVLGPFRDDIVHLETATTVTHERYIRSSEGTSYGYMHSPEQSGMNRPQLKTEIDGLWIVGANSSAGHGIGGALTGGVFCAGEILDRPLIAEIALGEQLVDPGDIPPDPEHFDPLEYARGARLREKRAARAESQRARRVATR